MPVRLQGRWRPARDLPFLALSVAVVLCLVRSAYLPGFDLGIAGTDVSLVLSDLALAVLAGAVALRLLGRGSLPRPARAITLAAAAFSGWLIVSSAANGFEAVTGAAKLLEYGLLGIGAVLFVQRRLQLWLLVGLVTAVTTAAVAYAVLDFLDVPRGPLPRYGPPGGRQASFTGEHDLAALSSLVLAFGLATLFVRRHRLGRLPGAAIVVGAVGVTLGAALAGLLGVYLAIAAIVAVAYVRGGAARRPVAVSAAVAVLVTAGVVALRSGDLGSVLRYVGIEETRDEPGQYASSFSQRLIYAYIGGRIFLDNPVLGTGWHGILPPEEHARFLADARRRFPGQPRHYFPTTDGELTPQQTYDQILFELGVVGALLFLVLAAFTVATAVRVARTWPPGDLDEAAAYLPVAWVAVLAASLAGAALFGGLPLTAAFWLTLGVVALGPSLVPPAPVATRQAERPELAAAVR